MEDLSVADTPVALGPSGLKAFPIAYGMWRFAGTSVAEADAKVGAAMEAGITLFDTADIYGMDGCGAVGAAESLFGHVLKARPSIRHSILIATKCGIVPGTPYNSSAPHIIASVERSLRRLEIDVIDLMQIHRPDLLAHPAEIAEALTRLKSQGKIRAVGVSNHSASQTDMLQAHLGDPIATHQPEFSALAIEPLTDGVLDQCLKLGVRPLAWSPLGGGRLGDGAVEMRAVRVAAALDSIAAKNGVSRSAAALAWVMVHPSRPIPIIGTQRKERIREALSAFKVRLSRAEWYSVLVASRGERLP